MACSPAAAAPRSAPQPGLAEARDGHTRPRALALDASKTVLYAALSTADRVAVLDISAGGARHVADIPTCSFPAALAALPGGGVVIACRFDRSLMVAIPIPDGASAEQGKRGFWVSRVDAGPEHGHRGLALDDAGRFVYVASPARGGVKIVELGQAATLASSRSLGRFLATGDFPTTVRFVPPHVTGRARPLLLVSNLVSHTVTVHEVDVTGGLSPSIQTITTEAPVLDLGVVGRGWDGDLRGSLLLATHEDRGLSRVRLAVEGLDSVLLAVPLAAPGARFPFVDPGRGRRTSLNLTDRGAGVVVGLEALALDPQRGRLAIAGAGSDNVLAAAPDSAALLAAATRSVGTNPAAVALLPDGRIATADRLSDTISILPSDDRGATTTIAVGHPERATPAERGEVLFYSRALVPHNVATGVLSIYTCAACHNDGHTDGRRHPSKRNRFYSMTKTCRGLLGTEPFLSVGKPDTFAAFADNIVGTHAQGALDAPDSYDRYPVPMRLRVRDGWTSVTLPPDAVRAALAAYLTRIPVEPSPFVPAGRRSLDDGARRGLALFRDNCAGCHRLVRATRDARAATAPAQLEPQLLAGQLALTSAGQYDVGTPVIGEGGNNPPSLRGVWAAAPYFSDGSAATLEEVMRRTNPNASKVHAPDNATKPPAFSGAQRADLLSFLRAL